MIGEWVKTQDCLPSDETPVLILHKGKLKIGEVRWDYPNHEDSYRAFRYWDNPNDDGQMWDMDDVTHWMLLPIPPEMKL